MAYPTAQEITDFLTSAGLTLASEADEPGCLAEAIAWWETETGWLPFLATSQTRVFDPPGPIGPGLSAPIGGDRILRLDCGLVTLTSLSIAGITKTQNTDFYLRPNNASSRNRPYEWIEFSGPIYGSPRTISIAGTWGFSATIPDDVKSAVLRKAAALLASQEQVTISGGLQGFTEGDTTEKYGDEPLKGFIDRAEGVASRTAARYRRVTVGI